MNWLNGWRKRNKLTADDNQMDKLTLDSAREQLAEQATEIQGLQTRIAEFETQLASLPQLQADLESAQADCLTLANDKASLLQAAEAAKENFAADLSAAQAQIADLQKKDMNADTRAAERLAGLSGKPLQISGNQEPNLSLVDISLAMDEANAKGNKAEANRLYALYQKAKSAKS